MVLFLLKCMAIDVLSMGPLLQLMKIANTEALLTSMLCVFKWNLEMWVGILELNDEGSYVPVAIEEPKDIKTGEVYVLCQVVCLGAYIIKYH